MNSYEATIDALLDILERKYSINEELLEHRRLLEYVTSPKNTESIKKFIVRVGRKKEDFNNKQHTTSYTLKLLEGMMKHSN